MQALGCIEPPYPGCTVTTVQTTHNAQICASDCADLSSATVMAAGAYPGITGQACPYTLEAPACS